MAKRKRPYDPRPKQTLDFSVTFRAPDFSVKKEIIDSLEGRGYVYGEDIIDYPYPDDHVVFLQLGSPGGYASENDMFDAIRNAIGSYGGGEVVADIAVNVRIKAKKKRAKKKAAKKKGKKKPRASRLRRAMRGT